MILDKYNDPNNPSYVCKTCNRFKEDHVIVVDSNGSVSAGILDKATGNKYSCTEIAVSVIQKQAEDVTIKLNSVNNALKLCWERVGEDKEVISSEQLVGETVNLLNLQSRLLFLQQQSLNEIANIISKLSSSESFIYNRIKELCSNINEQGHELLIKEEALLREVINTFEHFDLSKSEGEAWTLRLQLRELLANFKQTRARIAALLK